VSKLTFNLRGRGAEVWTLWPVDPENCLNLCGSVMHIFSPLFYSSTQQQLKKLNKCIVRT
jgi:hypothetical protein